MPQLPDVLNVLILQALPDRAIERIRAIAPDRINVITSANEFVRELEGEYSPAMAQRFAQGMPAPALSEDELNALLETVHVTYGGVVFPRTVPPRAPNLIFAHFGFAGTSNLKGTDWWGTSFITTSTRGYTAAIPIAEFTIAGMFAMAKKLTVAAVAGQEQRFQASDYTNIKTIHGKTMGIVGLGGIGSEVAKMAKGLGMRVVATRRSAATRQEDVDGVDELYPAAELHAMLGESDFVAVCAMWTDETERMMNAAAFEAMKPGSFLMNIARGEIIDNDALAAALHSGHVAGAYLDVWDDDFAKPPPAVLLEAPNVLYTPHVSNRSDVPAMFAVDVFCNNLQRLLNGEELENVIDWERGY